MNSGATKNMKTADLKSKCNLHDHKLQYLSGSDKRSVIKAPLIQLHMSRNLSQHCEGKITSSISYSFFYSFMTFQMTLRKMTNNPFWKKPHHKTETETCDITIGRYSKCNNRYLKKTLNA